MSQTLLRHMPLKNEPNFEKHYDYIIEYCISCVGDLKNWLHRSLRIALNDHAETLLVEHLKKGELSEIRRKQIREEAERGEKILMQESSAEEQSVAPSNNQSTQSKKGNSRPGQRKPKRDPVGLDHIESQSTGSDGSVSEQHHYTN